MCYIKFQEPLRELIAKCNVSAIVHLLWCFDNTLNVTAKTDIFKGREFLVNCNATLWKLTTLEIYRYDVLIAGFIKLMTNYAQILRPPNLSIKVGDEW